MWHTSRSDVTAYEMTQASPSWLFPPATKCAKLRPANAWRTRRRTSVPLTWVIRNRRLSKPLSFACQSSREPASGWVCHPFFGAHFEIDGDECLLGDEESVLAFWLICSLDAVGYVMRIASYT